MQTPRIDAAVDKYRKRRQQQHETNGINDDKQESVSSPSSSNKQVPLTSVNEQQQQQHNDSFEEEKRIFQQMAIRIEAARKRNYSSKSGESKSNATTTTTTATTTTVPIPITTNKSQTTTTPSRSSPPLAATTVLKGLLSTQNPGSPHKMNNNRDDNGNIGTTNRLINKSKEDDSNVEEQVNTNVDEAETEELVTTLRSALEKSRSDISELKKLLLASEQKRERAMLQMAELRELVKQQNKTIALLSEAQEELAQREKEYLTSKDVEETQKKLNQKITSELRIKDRLLRDKHDEIRRLKAQNEKQAKEIEDLKFDQEQKRSQVTMYSEHIKELEEKLRAQTTRLQTLETEQELMKLEGASSWQLKREVEEKTEMLKFIAEEVQNLTRVVALKKKRLNDSKQHFLTRLAQEVLHIKTISEDLSHMAAQQQQQQQAANNSELHRQHASQPFTQFFATGSALAPGDELDIIAAQLNDVMHRLDSILLQMSKDLEWSSSSTTTTGANGTTGTTSSAAGGGGGVHLGDVDQALEFLKTLLHRFYPKPSSSSATTTTAAAPVTPITISAQSQMASNLAAKTTVSSSPPLSSPSSRSLNELQQWFATRLGQ